jgi:hypothetical protein
MQFKAHRIFYVFTTDSYDEPLDGIIRFGYVVLNDDETPTGEVVMGGITYAPVSGA